MKCDFYSPDQLRQVMRYPHLIGHMVGKKKLTAMHSAWIRSVWLPEHDTALQAHRGAYKTTALTEVGCVYDLLRNPDHRILLSRETWGVANDTLQTIGQYMQNELVQELFRAFHGFYPETTTSREGRISFNFKKTSTKEGSIDAYGIETVPTGSHYDVFLPDDVVSIKDRFSRAKREKTLIAIQEIRSNILDPGAFTRATGTPWHKEDAWSVLPKPLKYDCYATGILTPDQIAEKKNTMTKAMFAANYELEHVNGDDLMFSEPVRGPWERSRRRLVAQLDAAYGGKDTTVLTIMGFRDDGKIQAWGRRWLGAAESVKAQILSEMRTRGCFEGIMEDNSDRGFLAKILSEYTGRDSITFTTYHETQKKHVKINDYLGHHWHEIVWADDTDDEYLAQIVDYTEGAQPDDAPDSAAALLRQVFFPEQVDVNKSLFS